MPAEVWDLMEGDARQWNRTCQLAAWMVLMIGSIIPKFGKRSDWRRSGSVLQVLSDHPAPGYRKDLAPKPGRVRRISTHTGAERG